MQDVEVVYLLTGGNIGNRLWYLQQAKEQLGCKLGRVLQQSSLYESVPWGFEHESSFLNQVLKIETSLTPAEVLTAALDVEAGLGRHRIGGGYTARTVDIDILFYGNAVCRSMELEIPHPRLHERMFTLQPLVEIDAKLIHPKLGKNVASLKMECKDVNSAREFLKLH